MNMDAIQSVKNNRVVLETAKGPVPNLAEAIARAPIVGSWWTHAQPKEIFRATRLARGHPDILVRVVEGKVSYIHRRLWAAVVRLAQYFGKQRLAAIREQHSSSGGHRILIANRMFTTA